MTKKTQESNAANSVVDNTHGSDLARECDRSDESDKNDTQNDSVEQLMEAVNDSAQKDKASKPSTDTE